MDRLGGNNNMKKQICEVVFEGETIRSVLYINFQNSNLMYMIMKSGNVVVLPINKGCPVQVGTISDLQTDFEEMKQKLESDKVSVIVENDTLKRKIEELAQWHGQQQIQ